MDATEAVTGMPIPHGAEASQPTPVSTHDEATIPREKWECEQREHHQWADEVSRAHRERRKAAMKHPVEDFLWEYYPFSPGQLRRWSPGAAVTLIGVNADDVLPMGFSGTPTGHRFAGSTLPAAKRDYLRTNAAWILTLQQRTHARAAGFGCFGLHEWAMVLDQAPEQLRHSNWQLRVDQPAINTAIESLGLRCTHFDAWRFFTPRATSLNPEMLSRQTQPDKDQPGCLHANMDLYKWAMRLHPIIPSDFVRAAFNLARRIRAVDMRASPYDFRPLGLDPIDIENPDGRAQFISLQRQFSSEAQGLRAFLITYLQKAMAAL